MDFGLKNKVAVITGGSKGIGYATAVEFLKEGAKVAICARDKKALAEAKKELSALGEVFAFACDITDEKSIYEFADKTYQQFGSIDCWVNNVGAPGPKAGKEYTGEEIDIQNSLTFKSVVIGCQAAFRYMKKTGGAIINISSLAARCPTVGRSTLYGPMKAAIINISNNFAAEYCAYGIRVCSVMPGFTITPAVRATISEEEKKKSAAGTLFRRMAEAEEIAKPIVFLAGSGASYITAANLDISNGRNLFLNPDYSYQMKEAEK